MKTNIIRAIFVFILSMFCVQWTVAQQNNKKVDSTKKITPFAWDWGKWGALKMSGYTQFQWQHAGSKGISAIAQAGDFNINSNNRFLIRRGRIKFEYKISFATFVFQPDLTQKGFAMRDIYLRLQNKNKYYGGQFGVFDRPFGYEISYSSKNRESMERSRVFVSLFPEERDVGAMAILEYKGFKLDAGLFNGNGIAVETDSFKDFIGKFSYLNEHNKGLWGMIFSYYYGGIENQTETHYTFTKDKGFTLQNNEKFAIHKREYFGVGARFLQNWKIGATNIRAEFLWGQQPGTFSMNYNIKGGYATIPAEPNYLRQFVGVYAIFSQQIAKSKHSIVLKYDYFDPNTQIKGDEIGALPFTGPSDIAYSTIGVGYTFNWNRYIKLTAYYEIVDQEKTQNIVGDYPFDYSENIKDNVLTLRLQVQF